MQAGLLSREIRAIGVPTPLRRAEGNTVAGASRELPADPARSKNLRMHGTSMRENREIPRSPAPDGGAGRGGKAKAASRR